MKYTELQKKIQLPVFSRHDLKLWGAKLFGYQLSLWQKRGYLIKLKNGVYAFADRLGGLSAEEVAGLLYSPCYLSLEKALSYYGLIPEMVYGLTLVTPKTTRSFKNRLGNFSYRHIQAALFFGYRQLKGKYFPYLIAAPEKALLDLIYFKLDKIKDKNDLAELRLNWPALKKTMAKAKFKRYLAAYKHKGMKAIGNLIMERL